MKNEWNYPQTLRGSFSAVSTATIATKYSFFQVFRDLQDSHTFAPPRSQNFSEKPSNFFAGMKMKFHFPFSFFDEFRDFSAKIWWNFAGISQKWLGNDKPSRDFVKKCEKNSEKCQKFPEIVKISIFHSIFPFVSLLFMKSAFSSEQTQQICRPAACPSRSQSLWKRGSPVSRWGVRVYGRNN